MIALNDDELAGDQCRGACRAWTAIQQRDLSKHIARSYDVERDLFSVSAACPDQHLARRNTIQRVGRISLLKHDLILAIRAAKRELLDPFERRAREPLEQRTLPNEHAGSNIAHDRYTRAFHWAASMVGRARSNVRLRKLDDKSEKVLPQQYALHRSIKI